MLQRIVLCSLLLLLALLAPPIAAACGVVGPGAAGGERVLIHHDGTTEQIFLELDMSGGGSEAAWVFPVPVAAEVQVSDEAIFTELSTLADPQPVFRFWLVPIAVLPLALALAIRFAARGKPALIVLLACLLLTGCGAVNVLQQQTLGPLEVTSLQADNAADLAQWLSQHGYAAPPNLESVVEPYIAEGWSYLVARLRPELGSGMLNGRLTPLRISFPSSDIIYPMRATALNDAAQKLEIYVLAEQRVNKQGRYGAEELLIARPVAPADVTPDGVLAPLLDRPYYLTGFAEQITTPRTINGDYRFLPTEPGQPFARPRYVEWDVALIVLILAGLTLVASLNLGNSKRSTS
jgi:hypothetical protein